MLNSKIYYDIYESEIILFVLFIILVLFLDILFSNIYFSFFSGWC